MRCLVAIDVPLLTAADSATPQLASRRLESVADLLFELKANKAVVLFSDSLKTMIWRNRLIPSLFLKAFANISTYTYSLSSDSGLIEVMPDVTNISLGQSVADEIKAQLATLHNKDLDTDTAYVIGADRGFSAKTVLVTKFRNLEKQHDLVNVTEGIGLDAYFSQFRPQLVQLKHHQVAYVLGGECVSPFSAYDPNNPQEAEELLRRAMDDSEIPYTHNNPPKRIFTWDARHGCYVCFHHTGHWEYHGFDIQPPYQKVPDYIKRKYNIWK